MIKTRFPPEVIIIDEQLEEEARNCFEAAVLRNIALREELKTLVFKWHDEVHVFNLLGDESVDRLHQDYHLMPERLLARYSLESGTINPYSVAANLPVVDRIAFSTSVFQLAWVFTNDGTLTGTAKIPTWILKRDFPDAEIFDYAK